MKLKGGGYVIVNILAMLAAIVCICLFVSFGLDIYTNHGESIEVPKVQGMNIDDARDLLDDLGLEVAIADSGFNKKLPAGQILEQTPAPGSLVKSGHNIFLTVNSGKAKSVQIPDIIDNSSHREAEAELMAMGFKVGEPIYVHGEKDWVYGIVCDGKNVYLGDFVSLDSRLSLQVGDGFLNEALDKVVVDHGQPATFQEEEGDDFELMDDEEEE